MAIARRPAPPKLRIGTVTLGNSPCVAVAVRDNVPRADLDSAIAAGAGIVEARIDQFASHEPAYVLDQLARLQGLPVLATIRHRSEGGGWNGPETARIALYERVLPHCGAVDVEIYAREALMAVSAMARAARKTVIGSYHDFHGMPSPQKMAATAACARRGGAHITKIAAMCRRRGDLAQLTRFVANARPEEPVIVIGMGEHGAASRIFLPLLGSLITYTFLGEATAPGQLNLDATMQYLSAFCPGFPGTPSSTKRQGRGSAPCSIA